MMKPGAWLINTARGGIVDEHAVADALRSGKLSGVVFDVFAEEPPPRDHPLFGCPNALLTPHVAGLTAQVEAEIARRACRGVVDVLGGRRPSDVANPQVL